jgi:hypothetical protein
MTHKHENGIVRGYLNETIGLIIIDNQSNVIILMFCVFYKHWIVCTFVGVIGILCHNMVVLHPNILCWWSALTHV